MDMLYFLGYDLDEELPRHSTLSRTRQLYSEEVFKLLFRKVLSQCIDKGMVSGRRQAVDSVPVKAKANASLNSLQRKAVLKDGEDYAASLRDEAISTRDADGVAVVAYNLKKLLRFQAPKVNAAVVKMMKKAEKSLQSLFLILQTLIASYYIKKWMQCSYPYSRL